MHTQTVNSDYLQVQELKNREVKRDFKPHRSLHFCIDEILHYQKVSSLPLISILQFGF